jgi:hypothetical protein
MGAPGEASYSSLLLAMGENGEFGGEEDEENPTLGSL